MFDIGFDLAKLHCLQQQFAPRDFCLGWRGIQNGMVRGRVCEGEKLFAPWRTEGVCFTICWRIFSPDISVITSEYMHNESALESGGGRSVLEWVRKMADATETVLSVMVTDSASIDTTVLRAWINGLTPRECARLREPDLYRDFFNNTPFDQLKPELKQRWRAAQMLNMQECAEEYQVCEWMSPYMCQPHQFQTQLLFNLDRETLCSMVAEFYTFDEGVMREFLGKTLNKTVLRELEDIAEQTKVPVVSVRRQFHNLKRIVAFMEQTYAVDKDTARLSRGSPSQISILEAIGNDFLLPVELASQYMHMTFLATNRIETSKSRLHLLDYKEWNSLTGIIMAVWGSDDSIEFDQGFLDAMRVAKEKLSAKEILNQYRKFSLAAFKGLSEEHQLWHGSQLLSIQVREQATRQRMQSIDGCFTLVIKNTLQIGAGLQEAREVRDLFIDIHEKVLEPLHKADMTLEQVILIFQVLEKVLPNLSVLHHKSTRDKNSSLTSGGTPGSNSPIAGYPFPPWATAWRKCIEGVKMLTVTMYPALFGRVA